MVDPRASGRLGRRISSKCASPASSDMSATSTRQLSPCALSGAHSPSGVHEYECVLESGAKTPPGATASSSQQVDVDPDVNRGRETETPSLVVRVGRAFSALGVYVTLSILTIFWTKHLIGGQIPTPLFLSWVQQAVGLILHSVISAAVASSCDQGAALGRTLSTAIPVVRLRAKVLRRVLPLSFCFVGMIGSANLCLQRVQVSVYQVARSLTLVFSLLLSVFWLKQRVVKAEVFSCLLVALGFALMTAVGSDASPVSGYVMGALASLFQAMYTVQMKATLNSVQEEAEILLQSPKRRSVYQLIGAESSDASPGNSTAAAVAEARTTPTTRGVEASSHCTAVVVEPILSAPSSPENDPLCDDGVYRENGIRSVQDESMKDRDNSQALQQKPMRDTSIRGSPGVERRVASLELEEDSSRGCDEATPSCNGNSGPPRAEPLCMFYNMLNALCLFPIIIVISDEPRVLWNLATEGSMLNMTVLAQVIGLGVVTFILGTSIFWTVSLTSPLSFSVAGYVKTLLQVAVAMLIWGERLSLVETSGFLLTLSGSLWYSISRCKAN